jgi:hypothetical protein
MKEDFETKTAKIKAYLLAGNTITSWDAITKFNCTRLSAVIFNLKNIHGMNIDSVRFYEDKTNYTMYWLHKDDE